MAITFRHDNVNYVILPSEIAALQYDDNANVHVFLKGSTNISLSLYEAPDEIIMALLDAISPPGRRPTSAEVLDAQYAGRGAVRP